MNLMRLMIIIKKDVHTQKMIIYVKNKIKIIFECPAYSTQKNITQFTHIHIHMKITKQIVCDKK